MSFRGDDPGRIRGEMRALTSGELLSLPVRLGGIAVGWPVDLVLDPISPRALGLEVRCGDGAHRFLALAAARVGEDEISIDSGLTLVDDVAFYRSRGTALASLRGGPVERGGRGLGRLKDVRLASDGSIVSVVASTRDGEVEVPAAADLRLVQRTKAPAA
jgi:hypothetical protein